jgi:Aerotolerance regulator N-terminal
MGALEPLFFIAGVAAAVPLLLHLLQRHQARRLPFPALRYLERTERDHARSIRSRQILLLLIRVALVVLVVGAGARLFLRGRGSGHPPTGLVIVLDNSMSSGLVVGGSRVFDQLRNVALRTLAQATDQDRIWVLEAGEPWATVAPTGPAAAREEVRRAEPTDARGDLSEALAHAAALTGAAALPGKEIHLLSDLQATAFDDAVAPAGDARVLVWAGSRPSDPGLNGYLASVAIGGGLSPLAGERPELAIRIGASHAPGRREPTRGASSTGTGARRPDTAAVSVRVVVGDQVRAVTAAPPGATATVALPAVGTGWEIGYAETDPDALRADDRRYFAFRARPAPVVAVAGDPGAFVRDALVVLRGAGRIRPGPIRSADLLISASAVGLDGRGRGTAAVVVPPADATRLPALNRRLRDAGIPWSYQRESVGPGGGRVTLRGERLPDVLAGVEAHSWYHLSPIASAPNRGDAAARILARAGSDPWAVGGTDPAGRRYLLLASPLDRGSGSLPVSATMIPFMAWVTGGWGGTGEGSTHVAGMPIEVPQGASSVRLPSGASVPVDAAQSLLATGQAGVYTFFDGDSVLREQAVDPSPRESDLTPLDLHALSRAVGPGAIPLTGLGAWDRRIFLERTGHEVWWELLAAALVLLLVEGAVAAGGIRARSRPSSGARELGARS